MKVSFIAPMLCKAVAKLPDDGGLLYEIKMDGFRCTGENDGGKVRLLSRKNKPLNFPEVREAVRTLSSKSAVL
jgi:ATP-dependent DNA ligase